MIRNGIYNLAGTVARLVLSILSVPLLIKYLGAASYGLYAILFAIVNFAVLTEWSVSMALTVFLPEEIRASSDKTSGAETLRITLLLVFCLSAITTLCFWVGAPYSAILFDNLTVQEQDILQRGIQLASLIVFTRLMQQYFVGIEQAHGRYKLLNSINTLYNLIQTTAILAVAWWYKAILPLIITQVIVSALFVVCHAAACYRNQLLINFRWRGPLNWSKFRHMTAYSSRTYLGAVGTALFSQGDRIVVGKLFGLEASGIYAALTGIVTQIHALSTIPVQPVMHAVSTLLAKKSDVNKDVASVQSGLSSVVSNALSLNATVSVGLGCLVILIAPEIVTFTFGASLPTLINVVLALWIVALIYSLYALNAVGYYILFAVKQEMVSIITSIVCGSLTLLFIYVLGKEYGLMGAFAGNAGYILTLFMLYKGVASVKLPWMIVYKTVGLPVLILVMALPTASILDNFAARLLSVVVLSIILISPQLKHANKLITMLRQPKSSLR